MKTNQKELLKNSIVWSVFFGVVAYGIWVYLEYGVI